MGIFSELDMEQRYGDDPFMEDDPFVEDDDQDAAETKPAVTVEPDQAEDTSAAQPQANPAASAASDTVDTVQPAVDKADEDAKRKAHEEAEAQRKAEWEAAQKKKKADELLQLAKLDAMSDEEVLTASTQRVSTDTEKITRRNMMECVMEHIQTLCLDDPAFARKVMHPRKNMIRCYQYINRKAWEYVQDEMKAKGIQPGRDNPAYASAIPEGVCYQWATDYFCDPDAKEDHVDEEKFVPQPYRGTTATTAKKSSSKSKGKSDKKSNGAKGAAQKDTKAPAPKQKDDGGQISFGNFAMPEEKAG